MTRGIDDYDRIEVSSAAELRDWLAANHARRESVWLVTFKKHTGDRYLSYDAMVEELIAFGWIDSRARRVDEDRRAVLISPRQPGSAWSRVNKERVAKLEADGRLAVPGAAAIEAARADGSWTFLDDVEDLMVPADLAAAFARYDGAADAFASFPRSARRSTLEWIKLAKRPETRQRRIETTARRAAEGRRVNES